MGAIVLGLFVGFDNLAVATGMGMIGLPRRRRFVFAAACAVFEMVMPLVGVSLGAELRSRFESVAEWVAPACLAACSLLVVVAVVWREVIPRLLGRPSAMILVPLVLSMDNLAAGAQVGTGGLLPPQAAAVGAFSGSLCLLGFALGEHVRLRAPVSASILSAVWLFGCAALSVLADHS